VLPILLAALSAAVWGVGDFSGGKATQTANALGVTVLSQLAGVPVLAACVVFTGGSAPRPGALVWGMVAGLAGFGGILLLYRGLAQGVMAVFAPVSAVTSALVPLAVGLVVDRTPSVVALAGVACAVAAIGLVSASGGRTGVSPRVIGLALTSGALFGVFFVLIGKAGAGAGLWPLVGMRISSISVGLLIVAGAARGAFALGGRALRWALVGGPLDILANVLYAFAAAHGPLAVVAPISALYPVSTVLLALSIDRERVAPVQIAGLGLAAAALVLVAT
jgi:drug/metabolite transporter (DMT)-like permease